MLCVFRGPGLHRDAGGVFAVRGAVQRQAGGNNEGHGTEGNVADGFQNRRSQLLLRGQWRRVQICRSLGLTLPVKHAADLFL